MIVTGQRVVDWVAGVNNHYAKYGPGAIGIGVERDGRIVGGAVFNDYTGANINIHFASDGKKTWVTREFLWFVFYYAFEQARVKRVSGFIWESNTASVEFARRIGGEIEARLIDAADDGDVLLFKMTKDKCKWLRRKTHEQIA